MKREQIRNIFNVQVRNGFLSDSVENGFWCGRCNNGNELHGGVSAEEKMVREDYLKWGGLFLGLSNKRLPSQTDSDF